MERVAEGGSGIHRREPASPDHRIVSRMALKSNDSPKLRGFESDSGPLSAFFRFWILPRFKEALSRLFSLIRRCPSVINPSTNRSSRFRQFGFVWGVKFLPPHGFVADFAHLTTPRRVPHVFLRNLEKLL